MANRPTEFGGAIQRNGIMPPVTPKGNKGHTVLTAAEMLALGYKTGQVDDTTRKPDNGETFEGILPLELQLPLVPKTTTWIDENG